ncbi:MAG: sulfatase-like hydrolase/transferase [Magnetococcales bacterium]|nr:sulfatase-like hydrolase/transferase [Magnetococcales bacterium]NGZ28989.1 sulfatase-like hydrolase/transferase [Magnetococcales bacterium]
MSDPGVTTLFLATFLGLLLSFILEGVWLPRSRDCWRRPWIALAVHGGIWLIACGPLLLILGRPWFAMAILCSFWLLLLLVNQAKTHALREPFVFQDFDYFLDAMRHPRLYLPFFGLWQTVGLTILVAGTALAGWWLEEPLANRFSWQGELTPILLVQGVGHLLVIPAMMKPLRATFDPWKDINRLGFLASLWCYGWAEWGKPNLITPFEGFPQPTASTVLPHLVAIQSESFFDPRPMFAGIRTDLLKNFDRCTATAAAHGPLTVPAWGANTVRSEFAFLSGIGQGQLGVHRFNPFRVLHNRQVITLATHLQRLGYRTLCVHPYSSRFYRRDRVYANLGFDQFIDINAFADGQKSGPFIGDLAVGEKVGQLLQQAEQPLFLFVITMENHGPLHLEKVGEKELAACFHQLPPAGCADLGVYLHHLGQADAMLAQVTTVMENLPRPAGLCWFGDHVPIMPHVYATLGYPTGESNYLLWRAGGGENRQRAEPSRVEELAANWLQVMGVPGSPSR